MFEFMWYSRSRTMGCLFCLLGILGSIAALVPTGDAVIEEREVPCRRGDLGRWHWWSSTVKYARMDIMPYFAVCSYSGYPQV
ncbi:hypothetical protein WA026_020386 [Henosepilachna vigintioctopunctata]|uniref:Secreted protein n=1 Tax=Henosepilachna vigintioctopunctata TaxID=420089 RepID=A0AAW1UHY1_9CUCU